MGTGESREVVEPGEIPPRGRGPVEAKCREPGLFLPRTADWSPRSRGTRNRWRAAGEDEHLRVLRRNTQRSLKKQL